MLDIEKILSKYRRWLKNLDIKTTADVNRYIREGNTNKLINISEMWHEYNISQIAKTIHKNIDTKKLVLISGPSSSGKTSFACKLSLYLKVFGINAHMLSLDDYFYEQPPVIEDSSGFDFDSIEVVDYPLFNEHIKRILDGEEVKTPLFDFDTHKRLDMAKLIKLQANDIVIVEGIHALNEKISSTVGDGRKYRVYCSAITALETANGQKISSQDTRLIRRLIRDCYFRSSSYKFTLDMWDNVESGAVKNIYPYTSSADIIFNSSVLYEFCVYQPHLDKILEGVLPEYEHYETIKRLNATVDELDIIDENLIPRNSILREFIGGTTLF